jgi:hypothetical protein
MLLLGKDLGIRAAGRPWESAFRVQNFGFRSCGGSTVYARDAGLVKSPADDTLHMKNAKKSHTIENTAIEASITTSQTKAWILFGGLETHQDMRRGDKVTWHSTAGLHQPSSSFVTSTTGLEILIRTSAGDLTPTRSLFVRFSPPT